jgi:hypothetical protein
MYRGYCIEPRTVALSGYGWLKTFYGWLAG